MQSIAAILSVTELFDNLSKSQRELVASICTSAEYESGHILMKEHDKTSGMYIIARGSVQVMMNPSLVGVNVDENMASEVLTELRQGQVFGEVSLIDEGIRSATIRVNQEGTQLINIPREKLIKLCDTYPELGYKFMKNVAADLAYKIRNTDLTVRQYQLLLAEAKSSEDQ